MRASVKNMFRKSSLAARLGWRTFRASRRPGGGALVSRTKNTFAAPPEASRTSSSCRPSNLGKYFLRSRLAVSKG